MDDKIDKFYDSLVDNSNEGFNIFTEKVTKLKNVI